MINQSGMESIDENLQKRINKMADEVIRYGAGGVPYKGNVGPQSTEAEDTPPSPEAEEEEKVDLNFQEDDTPVTDGELADKTGKGK